MTVREWDVDDSMCGLRTSGGGGSPGSSSELAAARGMAAMQKQKQARCVCARRCGEGVADVQPLRYQAFEGSGWVVTGDGVVRKGQERPSQKWRARAGAGLVD